MPLSVWFPAAEAGIAGDDDARLRIFNAIAQRRVPQASVYHRVNRSNARTSQHGDRTLDGQRHVDQMRSPFFTPIDLRPFAKRHTSRYNWR